MLIGIANKEKSQNWKFTEKVKSLIPGSIMEREGSIKIPHIQTALVIHFRGPNEYNTFSMFHYNNNEVDRTFFSNIIIPPNNLYPADFVVSYCMWTLIEDYEGHIIENLEIPSICYRYWNKILNDPSAELIIRPNKKR